MSEEYDQKQMLGDPKRRPAAKKYIKQDVSGGIRLEPKECIPMEDISPKAQQRVSEYNQQRGNRNTLSSDDDGDSESWSATKPSRRSATFEELNRFAQSVRNQEAMSAEDRHRQMSIVYSRRKRLRQKHRIEHFELQCDEYRVKNERLRHENMHLEAMLATAHQQLRKEGVRLNELLQEQQQQQQQEQTKTQQSPSQPSLPPPPPPQLSGNTAQPPNQSQNPFMRGHLASIMDNNNQNHHSLLSSLFAGNLTAQTINDDRNKFTSSATEGNNAYNDNAILNNVLQQMLQHQRLQHPQLQNPTKSPSQQQKQKSGVNHSTSRRRSGGGEEEEHGSAAINLSLMIQRMQQSLQAQQPATPQQQQRSTSPQQQRSTQQQSPSAQAKQFSPRSQE